MLDNKDLKKIKYLKMKKAAVRLSYKLGETIPYFGKGV